MMRKLIFTLCCITTGITCLGCSDGHERHANDDIAFERVIYLDKVENSIDLKKTSDDSRLSGLLANDIMIVDSLMFVSTNNEDGLIEARSLKDFSLKAKFGRIGKAKGEFGMPIQISTHASFVKDRQAVYAYLYDYLGSKYYRFNVTEQIRTGHDSFEQLYTKTGLPQFLFWTKQISESTMLGKGPTDNFTRQKRILIKDGKIDSLANLAFADHFTLPPKSDFNVISSLAAISPDGDKCVEAFIMMNYINVFSTKDGKGFTICDGDKLDQISQLLKVERKDKKYTFAGVRTYDFGFAVLKEYATAMQEQMGMPYQPTILLFDWDGRCLAELNPGVKFSHFDMDLRNKKLYIVDESSAIQQYDLPDIEGVK